MKHAIISAHTDIKVPFHDVDSATVVWHGFYPKYFEVARCELLDKIDYNYLQMMESGYFWPIIDMRIRYAQPATFGQTIRVEAHLIEWEHRLKIEYVIYCAKSKKRLTKGYTVQVAVDQASKEMLLVSPSILADKLGLTEDA